MLRSLFVGALYVAVPITLCACGSPSSADLFSGAAPGGTGGSGASGGSAGTGSGGLSGSGGTGAAAGSAGFSGAAGQGGVSGTGGSAGAGGANGCDLSGFWASYAVIKVTWPQTSVIKGGDGALQVWLLHERTHSGGEVNDVVHLCGIQIPGFETSLIALNEKYGVRFLADAFDPLPTFPAHATVDSSAPGATFQSDAFAIMFGAALQHPLTDPWPSLSSMTLIDSDADGQPGVTVQAEKGSGYAAPPVDLLRTNRAKDLFIASRTASKLTGTLSSCDEMSGTVEVVPAGGSTGVSSHIVGCRLENNALCNSQQTSFADGNSPTFQPASGSTLVSHRVDAQTSCANVRAMFP